MLYKDEQGNEDKTWKAFQHKWCRPKIIWMLIKERTAGK
jgi:hypothetical protein